MYRNYRKNGNKCTDCGEPITDSATWCRSCCRRHYKEEKAKVKHERELMKKKKTPLENPDTTLCRSCMFACKKSGNVECDYITITGHSRMCFGKPCDKYRQGRLKKIYGKNLTTLKKHTKHTNTYKLLSADDDCIEVIQIGTGIIRRLKR